MLKDNRVFFVCFFLSKSYLYLLSLNVQVLAFTKKKYHLSTHMYDQIYFDRLVQFHPSMRSELYLARQLWSEKLIFMRIQCMHY